MSRNKKVNWNMRRTTRSSPRTTASARLVAFGAATRVASPDPGATHSPPRFVAPRHDSKANAIDQTPRGTVAGRRRGAHPLASGPTRRQDGAMRPRVIVSNVASMEGTSSPSPPAST